MVVLKEFDISGLYHNLGEPGEKYYISNFTAEIDNKDEFTRSLKNLFSEYGLEIEGDLNISGYNSIEINDFSFTTHNLAGFLRAFERFLKRETESYSCDLDGGLVG